ncbi:MAG: exodeoxyribonuclease V subunit gamma, partial [Actinobacteria bacterium]|nr:exodeoxyribonuclease V subunit gamma [Actinomycetota bacterium]
MVRSWAKGDDVDGDNRALPEAATWQAELWRRLAKRLDTESPAQRLEQACATLRNEPTIVDLPRRLSMFGLTRLPASYLQVLHALGANRDMHLFLLHPSPKLWQRIDDEIGPRAGIMRREVDQSAKLSINPLLTSWGRDAREMQLVLTAGGGTHEDHHHEAATESTTLLQRLQEAVRHDEAPAGLPLPGTEDARPELLDDDTSVQVHDCHGRARQVEVVRDVVLHLLADDPTLEARDIIVMCPDIETYAPLIHATFGAGDVGMSEGDTAEHTTPDLKVRLADRSIRQTNPVLAVASELLTLTDSRLTAPQVLDLASRDPVRRRFHFDDDDLARLKEWVAATGVRWGLDAPHRAPFKIDIDANTWRAGLDRTLLGVAMADEDQRLFGGVLPLDDVESGAIDLAGRFAELIDRLYATLDSLRDPQPLTSWTANLQAAATALTASSERDSWQPAQLKRLLDDLDTESAAGATRDITLALPEIRSLLADRLKGRPTRANFRTGHLTVCTLVPMRSVPHRVVI